MKIKFFANKDISYLEKEINEWFEKNPNIKIERMGQSESCDAQGCSFDLTVSFLYQEA